MKDLRAIVYGQTIKATTMSGIKSKATKIANKYNNHTDTMVVYDLLNTDGTLDEDPNTIHFQRLNVIHPEMGVIERGKWK